jgi:hypothetical protein
MAVKTFNLGASLPLPEDIFDHAAAIGSLKGAVDAFRAALPDSLSGTVEISHSVSAPRGPNGPRKPKAPVEPPASAGAQVTLEDAIAQQAATAAAA